MKDIKNKSIISMTCLMPFITAAIIWLFTTQIDTSKKVDSLAVKVDTFNVLNAAKVQVQIENMEENLSEVKESLEKLNEKLDKDQNKILEYLEKTGNK